MIREQLLQSIKLDAKFAPAYYLLGVVDSLSDRSDEALEMAQRALQLSPGDKRYARLVESIKQYRAGNTTAGEPR